MQALITAITVVGGQQRLANKVGLGQTAVANWLRRGAVPAEHCAAIELATGGQVTRQDLRPMDWQKIWPELVGTGMAEGQGA